MPKHTHTHKQASDHYDEITKYLSQAQAVNLVLWSSSEAHDRVNPVFWLMDDLLSNIDAELEAMRDAHKRGEL